MVSQCRFTLDAENMNLDKRLLLYLSNLKVPLAAAAGLSLLVAVATVMQAKLLSSVIAQVFLQNHTLAAVRTSLLLFLGAALIRYTSQWGGQTLFYGVAATIKKTVRQKITAKLVRLGPAYVCAQQSGELKTTLLSGVEKLDAYFSEYLPQLFLAALIPLLILIFIIPVDWLSGLVLLITAPLIPFFMILIGDVARALTRKQWNVLSRLNAFFIEILQGMTTLKILGRARDQAVKIHQVTEEFRATTMQVLRVAFLSALVLELLSTLTVAVIAVEIGLRLLYGKMAFEQTMFILILAPEFYQPLRQLGPRFHAGMEGFTAAKRIFELLDEQPQIPSGRLTVPASAETIFFKEVSFTYVGSPIPAVADVFFCMAPGQKTALVGPSGAGKTTIASLLLRFIEPQQGCIMVGGTLLSEIHADLWQSRLTWVPQLPYLFHGTVLENICLADKNASMIKVRRAAQQAFLHDFIETLPRGFDTIIGERGARLSGGQAHRLALARAFFKDAPLIVLDEPTGSLDAESELMIQKAVDDLVRQKTVLTIVHRLHTITSYNLILFLDQGKIVESGSHEELMSRHGRYADFVKTAEAAL